MTESSISHAGMGRRGSKKDFLEESRQESVDVEIDKQKEQEIELYISDFYDDFYDSQSGYDDDGPTIRKKFSLVDRLMSFLQKNNAIDRLKEIIPNLYYKFVEREDESEYDYNKEKKERFSTSATERTLRNFDHVYKSTGIPPSLEMTDYHCGNTDEIFKIFNCPELKAFGRLLTGISSAYDKNLDNLLYKLKTGEEQVELVKYLLVGADKAKIKQACYEILQSGAENNNEVFHVHNLRTVALLKKAAGVELSFDPQLTQEWYGKILEEYLRHLPYYSEGPTQADVDLEKAINDFRSISGIAPDFTQHAQLVQEIYQNIVTDVPYKDENRYSEYFESRLEKLTIIKRIFGVEPILSQETIQLIVKVAVARSCGGAQVSIFQVGYLQKLEKLMAQVREVFSDKEEVIKEMQRRALCQQMFLGRDWTWLTEHIEEWFPTLKLIVGIDKIDAKTRDVEEEALVSVVCDEILLAFRRYDKYSYNDNIDQAKNLVESLERLTGFGRSFNPETTRAFFTNIVTAAADGYNFKSDCPVVISKAEALVGEKAVFDTDLIQKLHKKRIEGSLPNIDKALGKSEELQEIMSIALPLNWTEQEIKGLYLKFIKAGADSLDQVARLEAIIGSRPDFSLMRREVLDKYNELIEQCDSSSIFREVQTLEKVTGIKREFDSSSIQKRCDEIITQSSHISTDLGILRLVTRKELFFDPAVVQNKYDTIMRERYGKVSQDVAYLLTIFGIAPQFKEESVFCRYKNTVENDLSSDKFVEMFEDIAGVSKIPPSAEIITGMFIYIMKGQSSNTERYVMAATVLASRFGLEPDWPQVATALRSRLVDSPGFVSLLSGVLSDISSGFGKDNASKLMNDTWLAALQRMLTATEFEKKRDAVIQFVSAMVRNKTLSINEPNDAAVLTAFADDIGLSVNSQLCKIYAECYKKNDFQHPPEQAQAVITDLFAEAVAKLDDGQMAVADRAVAKFSIEPDWSAVVRPVRDFLAKRPRDILRVNEFLANSSIDKRRLSKLCSAYEQDPWVSALKKLQKIQGINANEANDPWAQEFQPLLASLFNKKILSLENKDDVSLMVEYVKRMGMLNTLKTCQLFIECQRAKSFEELTPAAATLLENFGIKLRRSDGSWRFPSPRSLVNELDKALLKFHAALLDNKIPEGLTTELGEEQFSRLIGKTRWERGDKIGNLVKIWQETVASRPELAVIPAGFQNSSFSVSQSVSRRINKKETESITAVEPADILKSKEMTDSYLPLASAIHVGLNNFTNQIEWWSQRKTQCVAVLENQARELQNWLAMTPQTIENLVAAEADPDKKNILFKKQKALTSEKGRQGMVKQIVDIQAIKTVISQLAIAEEDESASVEILKALTPFLKSSSEVASVFSELSAVHMIKVAPEGWRTQLNEQLGEEITPSVQRVEFMANFARQYIFEHYLHKDQLQDHTGHTAFDNDLRKALERVWQQQFDKKGVLPIECLFSKIKTGGGRQEREGDDSIAVDMLPVTGLLRIYAGDIGDACYTSRHRVLAEGEFPRVRAWIYAVGGEKMLRGSLLGVETTTADGVPTLAARANNPQENFIQSVSADQFVVNSLLEVVATAKRIREHRLKQSSAISAEQKRQYVVISLSDASVSSTNRVPVAEVYKRRWGKCNKVGLTNEPETNFNGYHIWDKNNRSACGVVWEIDEKGNETWYGDWDLEKKNK